MWKPQCRGRDKVCLKSCFTHVNYQSLFFQIFLWPGCDRVSLRLLPSWSIFSLASSDYDRTKLTGGTGERYHILDLSFKPYPSCRMTHGAIQGVIDLKKKYAVTPNDIENVRVVVSSMVREMVGNPFKIRENPQVDAQFSIPYTVAVALTMGDVFIEDFEESNIQNSNLRELVKRIEVTPSNIFPANDIKHALVEITLKNGRRLETEVNALKGSPESDMDWNACVEKFKKCAAYSSKAFSSDSIDILIDRVMNLERLENVSLLSESLVA